MTDCGNRAGNDSNSDVKLVEAQLPPSFLILSCIHLACTSPTLNLTSQYNVTLALSSSLHMCVIRVCVCV